MQRMHWALTIFVLLSICPQMGSMVNSGAVAGKKAESDFFF
jgi:ribosomal protein L32